MTSRKQREKDENEVANSCVTILAGVLEKELGEHKLRKDGKAYIEYYATNPETGKSRVYMRIDVMVRIFEEES